MQDVKVSVYRFNSFVCRLVLPAYVYISSLSSCAKWCILSTYTIEIYKDVGFP